MNGMYTFNKDNWSGEEATIFVKDNCFEFHGYTFKLVPKTWEYEGKKVTDYVVHGDDWDEPLFRIRAELDGAFYCHSSGIERQGKNPFILAAQMAANTI